MHEKPGDLEKLTKKQKAEVPRQLLPICPHCGIDPARFACTPIKMGSMIAMVFFCANPGCRKIFTAQITGVDQSPLVGPNGQNILNN
jgi:hypothetical protein